MKLEWSADALADLERFAAFLNDRYPDLARIVAREIVVKTNALIGNPQLGRAIAGHAHYRQIVLQVLNANYVFQYRVDGERIVMLRVFHGREKR